MPIDPLVHHVEVADRDEPFVAVDPHRDSPRRRVVEEAIERGLDDHYGLRFLCGGGVISPGPQRNDAKAEN